jgi:hypothetical protein
MYFIVLDHETRDFLHLLSENSFVSKRNMYEATFFNTFQEADFVLKDLMLRSVYDKPFVATIITTGSSYKKVNKIC